MFEQAGTMRDRSTIDSTTNRINSFLFKVGFLFSVPVMTKLMRRKILLAITIR